MNHSQQQLFNWYYSNVSLMTKRIVFNYFICDTCGDRDVRNIDRKGDCFVIFEFKILIQYRLIIRHTRRRIDLNNSSL